MCFQSINNSERFLYGSIGHDEELKRRLTDINKNVPKYMYRVWHSKSGGNPKLNTEERIMPISYLNSTEHICVYHFNRHTLNRMILGHLNREKIATEFSSWSASPHFALLYAAQQQAWSDDPFISILDTDRLSAKNHAFYVPLLEELAEQKSEKDEYIRCHAEYLVHGVVQGDAYQSVSFHDMREKGIDSHFPLYKPGKYLHPFGQNHLDHLPLGVIQVNQARLSVIWSIAALFGDAFQIPMFLALICVHKRSSDYWASIDPEDLDVVEQALQGAHIGDYLRKDNGEWTSTPHNIWTKQYEDIMQIIRLTKALHLRACGK